MKKKEGEAKSRSSIWSEMYVWLIRRDFPLLEKKLKSEKMLKLMSGHLTMVCNQYQLNYTFANKKILTPKMYQIIPVRIFLFRFDMTLSLITTCNNTADERNSIKLVHNTPSLDSTNELKSLGIFSGRNNLGSVLWLWNTWSNVFNGPSQYYTMVDFHRILSQRNLNAITCPLGNNIS